MTTAATQRAPFDGRETALQSKLRTLAVGSEEDRWKSSVKGNAEGAVHDVDNHAAQQASA